MKLAKEHLDVGLYTNNIQPMLEFWQQTVGLAFEEMLPAGGGSQQHRHTLGGGVLKINHQREPLPDSPPSGYRELLVVRAGAGVARKLADPDGNAVTVVPPGHEGLTSHGIVLHVRSLEAATGYYGRVLGFEERDSNTFACGETLLFLAEDREAAGDVLVRGPGYRYLTVQVWDCDAEFGGVIERGGAAGMQPRTMGSVARFGFVRDPDGNWLEISQRASITGPLPSG